MVATMIRSRSVRAVEPRQAACYLRSQLSAASQQPAPIASTMLFLGMREVDEADSAARDAAIDLGQVMDRPVLLLDVSVHQGAQHAYFTACGAVRPGPARLPPPEGQAAFHFHPIRDSNLWVSSLTPPEAASDEAFWQAQWETWPATRRRLLTLFGAVVIAAPSVMRSPRGLAIAKLAEATILVLRDGEGVAHRAQHLCDQVRLQSGHPVGIVMTGCRTDPEGMAPVPAGAPW